MVKILSMNRLKKDGSGGNKGEELILLHKDTFAFS